MLMESFAAGRSISLPALSRSAPRRWRRASAAPTRRVREQFDTPIGRFEGIEEPLARIAGMTYLMTATRTLTCGALDAGERPAVLGSIVKAYLTEGMRQVVTDAMDIRAGCGDPARSAQHAGARVGAVPIGITVEGANILTRSMIIYGQGAIRCHPVRATRKSTRSRRMISRPSTSAIFGHVNLFATRAMRAKLLALSGIAPGRRAARAGHRCATTSTCRVSRPRSRSSRTPRWARSVDR